MKLKKEIFGWSMYDFADTIFSALFLTIYFPLFIVLKGGNAFQVGLVIALSMLLAGLLVPLFGAVADITKRKKLLLFVFTLSCCILTFFTGFFNLTAVMIIGLLAIFFYNACLDIYDSMLVDISSKKNIGTVSGIGTAVGYLGTILSILLAYSVGYYYGFEDADGIRIIFMLTGVLFFGFSLFTFILIKEKSETKIRKQHFREALKRVFSTLNSIKKLKYLWIFLLASFLYVDAANTTIIFLYLYARDQIGLTLSQFFPVYAMMAITAGIGSLIFGKLADKIGHKKTMVYILVLWVVLIAILYIKTNYAIFLTAGVFGGALLGGVWTVTRPILIDLAPEDKVAELLGYQGLTEKFSGVLGPLLFGAVAVAFGFKQALLVVITLFIGGLIALNFVKKI